jgi:MSHA biogenesis protein MshL
MRSRLTVVPIALLLTFSGGCRTTSPSSNPAAPEGSTSSVPAAEERYDGVPPRTVTEALVPPIRLTRRAASPREQRFDVQVSNAPAREFFMSLVEDTQNNMVLHPDVRGEITMALKNVTLDEILNAVRDVYGYDFRKTAYGFYALPAGLRTKIFQVDYLNVRRVGNSDTRVSSGSVSDAGGSSSDSDSESSDSGSSSSGGGAESSQISTASEVDFWKELESSLGAIVGSEEGRMVVASPNTGIVVVRGSAREIREVEMFLESTQLNLTRQVVLEAKILEVNLNDAFQSGINWAALFDLRGSGEILGAQTGGGTSLGGTGLSDIFGNSGILDPSALIPIGNTDASAFGGVFSVAAVFDNFAAFVELLGTQGTVQTLSSPRVATVNNQKAVIKVGTDEFFVTNVSATTVTGTTTTTTPDIELKPFFSGIALDVTPQISEAGDIILHIHPSISEVQDQTKNITVGGEAQSLPLALSTIRESDSIVRATSGQVIVIGGLMEDAQRDNRAEIPWMGRIPVVGWFFGHERAEQTKSELVILLRAVLVEPNTFAKDLRRTGERFEKLESESGSTRQIRIEEFREIGIPIP